MFGLDWAWGVISASSLSAAHADFACRYLSHDEGKNLQFKEAKNLTKGGKEIVVVWETTAMRASQGYSAGVQDAAEAKRQAAARGKPDSRPIFFAVDFPATPGQIIPYFRGVNAQLGRRRVGAYGSYAVVKALFDAGLIAYAWQTYAWSGGLWDHRAHLQQYSNDHSVAGVSCDFDRSNAVDFGQWHVGQVGPPGAPKDPLWFMHADERSWIRQYNALAAQNSDAAKLAKARLFTLMVTRRKYIHKRGDEQGGKGWNAWHRRERWHMLRQVTLGHA